jgi:hypothetical protein
MDVCPPPLLEPTTLARAHGLGWTRRRLQRAVDDGRVRRVLRGVYVDASVPDSIDLRIAAAGLVMPPRMVVCDRSAAWLHGVDHWEPSALDVPPDLELVARSGTRTRLAGTHGALRTLTADDVMVLAGVAVTTPLRRQPTSPACAGVWVRPPCSTSSPGPTQSHRTSCVGSRRASPAAEG